MTCNRGGGDYNRNIRWLVTGGGLITGILDGL